MSDIVYLDNAATTPLCEVAKKALIESFDTFGNPSSLHSLGQMAHEALEKSRNIIKKTLFVKNRRDALIFCASGSEANNLAILGSCLSKPNSKKKKIITTKSEHPSVIKCTERLSSLGFDVVYISCKDGVVDEEAYINALDENVFLISVMAQNNETGAIYDILKLRQLAEQICPDAYFHTDATQAYTKMKIEAPRFDFVTVSGHKIGAPKGIGALYVSERVLKAKALSPVIYGGGQEESFRSGTENVMFAIAFAKAAECKIEKMADNYKKIEDLYNLLVTGIKEDVPTVKLNIPKGKFSPSVLSITVPNIKSEVMLHFLSSKGVFVSSGSACSSHHNTASPVMIDFGLDAKDADSTIRISLSENNLKQDIKKAVCEIGEGMKTLAKINQK